MAFIEKKKKIHKNLNVMASASSIARVTKSVGPISLRSKVIHGFGRGSKVLGFPTANMEIPWDKATGDLTNEEQKVFDFATNNETGIYAALACVENGADKGVYKAAVSVGWNPTFTDVKHKTIEPWILHDYEKDFYECDIRLLIVAYIRPELKFDSFDELIAAIKTDGEFCSTLLDSPEFAQCPQNEFFSSL